MTLDLFAYVYHGPYTTDKKDEKILESSEVKFINLPPHVFDVDHVTDIRSGLSYTVLEIKKNHRSTAKK